MTDSEKLEYVSQYRDAMVADDWDILHIYPTGRVERAAMAILNKFGFRALVIARPAERVLGTSASIAIWGPDSLAVTPPAVYDWASIQAGTRVCSECGLSDQNTERVGFAGRVCATCLPEARRKYEYSGWDH